MYINSFQKQWATGNDDKKKSSIADSQKDILVEESILPIEELDSKDLKFDPNIIRFKVKNGKNGRRSMKSQRHSIENGFEDMMVVANQKPTHIKYK